MSNPEEEKSQEQAEPLVFNEEEQNANFKEEEEHDVFNEEEHFNEEDQGDNFNEEEQYTESSKKVSFEISSSMEITKDEVFPYLVRDLHTCKGYYFNFEFDELNLSKITFRIPTTILPLSVSVVNGFYDSPYLIECKIEFVPTQSLYKMTPYAYTFTNPSYGELFPGSILVKNRFRNFFNPGYEPSTQYRCQNYVLAPQASVDKDRIDSLLKTLVNEGFPAKKAENALIFCSYSLSQARDYLLSGLLEQKSFALPVKYGECPLFYLILEICEAFFDIGDCCCVCGKKLGVTNLKPSCCDDKQCQFSFLNLGVGSNIVGDIKRDPLAADLIISLAGVAYSSQNSRANAFDPSPESQGIKMPIDFFSKLPSMRSICHCCKNDGELRELIGEKYFEVLRFFILANKAQLMTLPDDLKTSINVKSVQFLVTSVTPESELVFRKKREKYGVSWFWHGSGADRWYRILHTGLKNMARSNFQTHGGDGIFMSDSFGYSLAYSGAFVNNVYANSALPKKLLAISLLENAKVPELRFYITNEYTQHDESASITRVLFVIDPTVEASVYYSYGYYQNKKDYNVRENPPKVPTLHEVITHQMKKFI